LALVLSDNKFISVAGPVSVGVNLFSQLFVRRDALHLSKAIFGYWMVRLLLIHESIPFLQSIFDLTKFARERATYYHHATLTTMDTNPPLVWNHAGTWWGLLRHRWKDIRGQVGLVLDIPVSGILPLSTGSNVTPSHESQPDPFLNLHLHTEPPVRHSMANGDNVAHNLVTT